MADNSNPLEVSTAWIQWLETVPARDRKRVAKAMHEFDTSEFSGMSLFLQFLTAEVIAGNISPIVLESMRHLLDRMLATLFVAHQQKGAGELFQHSAARALIEVSQTKKIKMVNPTYTASQIPDIDKVNVDLLDADELVEEKVPRVINGD